MTGPIRIGLTADEKDLDRSLERAEAAIEDTARSASRAADRIDSSFSTAADGADTMASKSSQAAGALGDLGGVVADGLGFPGLGAAMENSAMWAQGLAGAGDALNLVTDSTIVKNITAKAATLGKAAADKAAAAAAKTAAAGQWALNAAMSANPIGLIVLALVALVAGLVIAYQKSETFRNIVNGAFSKVQEVVSGVVTWFREKVPAAWERVRAATARVFGRIRAIVSGAMGVVKRIFQNIPIVFVIRHWETLRTKTAAAFTWVRTRIMTLFGGVLTWVRTKVGDIVGYFAGLKERITRRVAGAFDGLKTVFVDALNWIIGKWNAVDFGIKIKAPDWLGGAGFEVKDIFPDIPRLAQGGYTTSGPSLVMMGDNPSGVEYGIPSEVLDKLGGGGGNTYVIHQQVHPGASLVQAGRELVRAIEAFEGAGGRRLAHR
jgi:phage-related protein